ncbi:uncharacterized protein LOC128679201 [Plodia interpunctella]|uniref:uncharacterized protein LOC128679201 n=1 Tax=Plodia interpunctella TaxID=58824 RepID=UPI002368800B|nr:uncharacterized protein LOC128679201 [Plodia interpunctella]
MNAYFKLLLILIFIIKCYCISEEYLAMEDKTAEDMFIDDEEDSLSNEVDANLTSLNFTERRSRNHKKKQKSVKSDNNEEYYQYDDVKFYVLSKKFVTESEPIPLIERTSVETNSTELPESTTMNYTTKSTPSTPYNIFQEYEYAYLEEETRIRQQGGMQKCATQIQPGVTKKLTLTETPMQYIDFFNLSPAVQEMSLSNITSSIDPKKLTSNIWYVPEKFPCWDLPVLYGEFSRESVEDVFTLHRTLLKNVIDMGRVQKQRLKSLDVPVENFNKWCSVSPCYGDHTLCLFEDNTYAKICGEFYSVHTPTTAQQVALVNTVNSMRNRIASGESEEYKDLPPAANMKQVIYDFDLEKMSSVWLYQCLPGPAPCSALDGSYVSPLECTKYAIHCCKGSHEYSDCVPRQECYLPAIIGCIYTWFLTALDKIDSTDVTCGHIQSTTYPTVQLLWANTYKIGCAYGNKLNGDIRVVCNFAPGAPFSLGCLFYCGLISHQDVTDKMSSNKTADFTNKDYILQLGIRISTFLFRNRNKYPEPKNITNKVIRPLDVDKLEAIYKQSYIREKLKPKSNRTEGMLARLVSKYIFNENGAAKCDSNEPMYIAGEPGSLCVEKGRRFDSLCYDFRDPTPGYRLVAVVAPMALFSVILYDLFSGVVRQAEY